MLNRLALFLSAVVLIGCATEQRLGESRIQSRRYAKGVYVQHHRDVRQQQASEVTFAPTGGEKGTTVSPVVEFEPAQISDILTIESAERTGLSGPAWPSNSRTGLASMRPKSAIEIPQLAQPVLVSSEELPSPIVGRHPNAVPGFILSLGWVLGIIGEIAVDLLDMRISGFPVLLGLAASILGYVVSRRAYRASLDHPELYPRFGLARAARFVAIGFLAPIALYMALVLIVIIALGGL